MTSNIAFYLYPSNTTPGVISILNHATHLTYSPAGNCTLITVLSVL